MQSARNQRLYQSMDVEKQRVLPKYDFPERLVNATPSVSRFLWYEMQPDKDDNRHLKLADSEVVVFNRPKHFIGSSG